MEVFKLISFLVFVCSFSLFCILLLINLARWIRRRFPSRVNCWFCNSWHSVPYDEQNAFVCPSCDQYNGFDKEGDYNCPIPAQYCSRLNPVKNCVFSEENVYSLKSTNGLCLSCNTNQEMKVNQLATFAPEREETYDEEVEEYRSLLEKSYKLCSRCERVVKRTLNRVKKRVLGSKLAQLGAKGRSGVVAVSKVFSGQQTALRTCIYTQIGLSIVGVFDALAGFEMVGVERLFGGVREFVGAVFASIFDNDLTALIKTRLQTAVEGIVETSNSEEEHEEHDLSEFTNISALILLVMLIVLSGSGCKPIRLPLLMVLWGARITLSVVADIHPIDEMVIKIFSLSTAIAIAALSVSCLSLTKSSPDNLNSSLHRLYADYASDVDSDEEVSDPEDSFTTSISTQRKLNSSYGKASTLNFSRSTRIHPTATYPITTSPLRRSPSILENYASFRTSMNELQNNTSFRSSEAMPIEKNPFFSHLDLDRRTLTAPSIAAVSTRTLISPPQLNPASVSQASWVAGGFWTTSPKKPAPPVIEPTSPPPPNLFSPIMSRTSSQSSGFESLRFAGTRENSLLKEVDCASALSEPLFSRMPPASPPFRPRPIYPQNEMFAQPQARPLFLRESLLNGGNASPRSNFTTTWSGSGGGGVGLLKPAMIMTGKNTFNFRKFNKTLPEL